MYLVLIAAGALAVASARAQCACEVASGTAYCHDTSVTSIPDCVPSSITTLSIQTPTIPLVKETIGRFKALKELRIGFFEYPKLAKNFLEGHAYLNTLFIFYSSLSYVDNDWFMYSPRITYLNLMSNKIASLPADTFRYLPMVETVYLTDNQLTIIPPTLFVGTALTVVNLAGNPWSCDCEIFTFAQWAKDNGVSLSGGATCVNPEELAHVPLDELPPDLNCKK